MLTSAQWARATDELEDCAESLPFRWYNELCMLFRWHYNGVWKGERLGLFGVDRAESLRPTLLDFHHRKKATTSRKRPLIFEATQLAVIFFFFLFFLSLFVKPYLLIVKFQQSCGSFQFFQIKIKPEQHNYSTSAIIIHAFGPFSCCLHW